MSDGANAANAQLQNFLKAAGTVVNSLHLQRRLDFQLAQHWQEKRERSPNPLVKKGAKFYSQNDEDGILLEIVRRLGLSTGSFAELGVGNGLENNSLILLMLGWRGVWLGGQDLAFRIPQAGSPLGFEKAWITRENVGSLLQRALGKQGLQVPDVLSVDLDGNDYYILENILATGLRPKVLIAEYNGKFPPPIRWTIAYNAQHQWDGSDYQGASLQILTDLAQKNGYRLVACNVTGVNAFFVDERHGAAFADVPLSTHELFEPADYNWFYLMGHRTSPRTIETFLQGAGA